ncbi:MAG: crossover junction endodeoxyribonuclease RuvC [Gammaproteobacteria bacterium]|nr:crossover junction endodeoxyribonuclease RuvC [Gammaproteobacteria bacterium]
MNTPATETGVRILGIDPGSRVTGYGIVESVRDKVNFVDCGVIKIGGDDFSLRLKDIFDRLGDVIETHGPSQLAIEKVFVHRNVTSALKLGQARGAALLAGATRGLAVSEYSPNEIKQAVTGRGHADKAQIQHMIRVLMGLPEAPPADAADALAVAICHAHLAQTRRRLAAAGAGVR